MNTNGWIDYLYANIEKLDKNTRDVLEMKKTKNWGEIGEEFNVSGEGARNRLYRVYKIMVGASHDHTSISVEDVIGVLNGENSLGKNIDEKIRTFRYLGAEKLLEIGLSNTRGLTIEYVHKKTGIPKKIIDANLGKYTASEIIAGEELFCSQKCVNSQTKYGGSSLL